MRESCLPVPDTIPIWDVPARRPPTDEVASTMSRTVDVAGPTSMVRPTSPAPLMTDMSRSMPSRLPASIVTVQANPWAGPTAMTCAGTVS